LAITPIHSLETNLYISPESLYTQSHTNLSNNSTITLNNTGNISREFSQPTTITLLEQFNAGFTITNLSTNTLIIIPSPETNYPINSIFLIYSDSVYLNNISTEISATFSAPFTIAEHLINTLQFTLPGSIDVTFSWIKSDNSQKEMVFVQGFSVNQNNTTQRQKSGPLSKHAKGYSTIEVNYDFSIDQLFLENDFLKNNNQDSRYQIIYKTDISITDIKPQTFYLSNCCFSGLGFSQGENDMVKQNIRGNCCQIFES
jgi:hypothetical protein